MGASVNRILIVEDEARLASFLERGLGSRGYATTVVGDGAAAAAIVTDEDFDIVILDLGLPDMDGLGVLRELRRRGERLPVILLTARADLADKIEGLDAGGSDYVTKPFKLEELLARIRAQLREGKSSEPTMLEVGGITLDLRSRKALAQGAPIDLTAREFTMLETLMQHPDQVLSREQLLAHVWGYDYDPGSNVVEVYVGYLRRKLGTDAIETVRGMGYRLRS
jgi:two-component system, OmpR family, response regulator QseB